MKIKISADSTCDLPPEIIEKYNISIIPLYIVKAGHAFKDGLEIKPQDIFQYVESNAGICNTSAINYSEYMEAFSQYLTEYDAVVHINLSSKISVCNQNAVHAASELENVYIVDSLSLSTGSGLPVLEAAIMAQNGLHPKEIKMRLDEAVQKVEASFVINTLKYLYKGGRCSSLAALGANILNLKPCIELSDGKMDVGKKYRGDIQKVFPRYAEDKLCGRNDIDYRRIFIVHTGLSEETLQTVRDTISRCGNFEDVIESVAGCTISNHCGPNTLGLMYYRK